MKCIVGRDGRPAPRGTLPVGKGDSPPRHVGRGGGGFPAPPCSGGRVGGSPAPPRTVGRGGFPAPTRPVKMIKTAGKLRGKIKAYI